MKPSFAQLYAAYPRKPERRATLYARLGIKARTDVPACMNTCGIRMSVAFIQAGFPLRPTTGNAAGNDRPAIVQGDMAIH